MFSIQGRKKIPRNCKGCGNKHYKNVLLQILSLFGNVQVRLDQEVEKYGPEIDITLTSFVLR